MDKYIEIPNQKFNRIFTVGDLEKLFKTGILSKNESVELVEGEILLRRETVLDELQKAKKIAKNLSQAFGDKALVKIQHSINLYEIQSLKPSIAVIKPFSADKTNQTNAEDTFFVIELTDLRFNYTENSRCRYYGQFNYPEVWFVNLDLSLVEVCTQPNYGYSRCRTYLRSDTIKSENSPDLQIEANKLLST